MDLTRLWIAQKYLCLYERADLKVREAYRVLIACSSLGVAVPWRFLARIIGDEVQADIESKSAKALRERVEFAMGRVLSRASRDRRTGLPAVAIDQTIAHVVLTRWQVSEDQPILPGIVDRLLSIIAVTYKDERRFALDVLEALRDTPLLSEEARDRLISKHEEKCGRPLEKCPGCRRWTPAFRFDQYGEYYECFLCGSIWETRLPSPPSLIEETRRILAMRVSELDLPPVVRNVLQAAGITTLQDLVRYSPVDLLRMKNMGRKSLRCVIEKLSERGLALGMPVGLADAQEKSQDTERN